MEDGTFMEVWSWVKAFCIYMVNLNYFLVSSVVKVFWCLSFAARKQFVTKTFQCSVAFHMDYSIVAFQLICTANQVTGFCMKCNTRLKCVKLWLEYHYFCCKSKNFIYVLYSRVLNDKTSRERINRLRQKLRCHRDIWKGDSQGLLSKWTFKPRR